MKNILEILKQFEIEIPEEKVSNFNKEVTANYKTIAEFEKTNNKLAESKQQIADINTQLEELKSKNATAEEWENKYNELKAVEQKRAEETQKAEKQKAIDDRFNEVTKDKEWTHEAIKNDYKRKFSEIIASIDNTEFKGKGDLDIITALTKDDGGAFKGVQTDVSIKGNQGMENQVQYNKDSFKNMTPDDINKHWEDISANLKNIQ